MRGRMQRQLMVKICVTAMTFLFPSILLSQRGLDRSLTRGSVHDTVVMQKQRILGFGMALSAAELKATWLIQPLASVAQSSNDFGLLIGYKNTNRFSVIPWQVDARALRRYRNGSAHARWQVGAEVDPKIDAGNRLPLLASIIPFHSQTSSVERAD